MNDNQRFDDNIKDQFQDYTPQVHPRIWENIVKEREKRRPVGFWSAFLNSRNIILLAALLLAGGSGAYFLLKKSPAKDDTIAVVNTTPNAASNSNNINGNNDNKKDKVTAVTVADNNHDEKATDLASTNSTTTNASSTDLTISKTNKIAIAAEDVVVSDAGANNDQAASTRFINAGKSKMNIHSPTAQTEADNIQSIKNKRNKKSKTTTVADDYNISDAELNNNFSNNQEYFLNKLSFAGLEKITAEKQAFNLSKRNAPNVVLPDCPTIEKNAAGNKTYFEIYGGPDMAFRSISDTGNSAYLQKRKESTSFSGAYSAGLRYTRVFNNGMSIRTGINYSQINEKFTFVQGNLVQVTYIIDANGDTTGSYITTGTRYKTTINKFKTIDVPLLIGYELGNGRFHANINAGVIINVYSWQKGEVLDMTNKPVNITTGKSSSPYQFKTNIGMGFMVSASVYYKLTERWHILAEPYYRYSLSPMSNEKLTLKQKYNTAGLRVGLRFDLH